MHSHSQETGRDSSCVLELDEEGGYTLSPESPSLTLRCDNGTLSELPTPLMPCSSDAISLSGNTTFGNCFNTSAGETFLASAQSCSLRCLPGFAPRTSSSVLVSCDDGVWIGSGPVCDPCPVHSHSH